MNQTRTIHDPFLNKAVEISSKLTDRLRGKYAVGPTLPNGEPEFGWRQHEVPPIQKEAADKIDELRDLVQTLLDEDPNEPIADNGMTVLDGWRERARRALTQEE